MRRDSIQRVNEFEWRIEPSGEMRVPAVIYASEALLRDMEEKVFEQTCNVATLPGIVGASYAMPDAHWGYGFPIGGVAAFDAKQGGVVSAGGVGFDISCGVRMMLTHLPATELAAHKARLADMLFERIPAGLGCHGTIRLDDDEMEAMLKGGAKWALQKGYGIATDLGRIEEQGCMPGANPDWVSIKAKRRQRDEIGTLGSGNHYLEIQTVADIFDHDAAQAFGLREGDAVVSIHCGSRGLGHQIGSEFLIEMASAAAEHGITLPDRELACPPSIHRSENATWVRCAPPSIARSPIGRSSDT